MSGERVNICCGHATCQRLVQEAAADAFDEGLVAAGESLLGIYNGAGSWTKPQNPYRKDRDG